MKLENLVQQISFIDSSLKQQTNKAVNALLTVRNWFIGYYIVEYEQHGEGRARYGKRLMQAIAEKLDEKGLSYTQLNLFRQFYLAYPKILQTVSEEFKDQLPKEILQTASEESESRLPQPILGTASQESKAVEKLEKNLPSLPGEKIITHLSFSHLVELIKIEDPLKRTFYEVGCINGTWSVRELKRQINTLLFERSGLSKQPEVMLRQLKTNPEPRHTLVKDIYTFEFLGLPAVSAVEEAELESALIEQLSVFILELGNGFCLEARQKRILIGDEYFFIDLVFYHRILKCHVLIELKVEEFTHENAGQLNTYLNFYKQEVKQAHDNDPIGILMVTDRNEALVEYATAGMDQNLFVSKYLLQLPSKEKLTSFLRDELKKLH